MEKDKLLAGQKILIAEDDQNSFYLLEYILGALGAEILHTETGEDTIQVFMDSPDVCLILMDIRMPGITGLETATKIRQFNADVIILAQTALMSKNDNEKILEAGCNDYILKPIDQDLLLEKIKHLLKASSSKQFCS